ANEFILKMHGGDEFALTGGQIIGGRLLPGLGDDAVAACRGQAGMRNQWALCPLGQGDVQAQGVIGRQRIGYQGSNLSGQLAAGPVCLGGDVALQLNLTEPEHQHEYQQQWDKSQQYQRAWQLESLVTQGSVATQKQIVGWARCVIRTGLDR